MLDVWWGLVEKNGPKQYDWNAYKQLFDIVAKVGLTVEATMSFQRCGMSVGDDCNVTLPEFVRKHGKDVFYLDKEGYTAYGTFLFSSEESFSPFDLMYRLSQLGS